MNISDTIKNYRELYNDVPADDMSAIKWIISRIKHNTPKSNSNKLTRRCESLGDGVTCEDTLDTYYVNMINDTLGCIRKGGAAYIFSLEQVEEIVRFEPDADFRYLPDNRSFAVTLENRKFEF